jgi:predicted RNA-binding protein YlxR (DUF448 family)
MEAALSRAPGKSPVRSSALTRERAPRSGLVRLVLDGEGHLLVDLLGRAPGRGTYVAPEELPSALKSLPKLFRGQARPLAEGEQQALLSKTFERLEARLLELIGLARRAGSLAIGMDPVLRSIASGEGPVVVLAGDLAEGSRRKIEEAGANVVAGPSMEQIGQRLGRGPVGVVATSHRVFAPAIRAEAARIQRLGSALDSIERDN